MMQAGSTSQGHGDILKALLRSTLVKDLIRINMNSRHPDSGRNTVKTLMGEDPEKLWQSNIFGKSVYDLIQEGLTTKLLGMPEEVRGKFRGTLTRIVNEGATGLICLIL